MTDNSSREAQPYEEVEVEDLDDVSEVIPFTYDITSYGADYPVDSLVKRMKSGDVIVPRFTWEPDEESAVTGFQREYVWLRPKADRFIESLLLGLPVPGIFLVKEPSGRLLILDGHQRLYTLLSFYEGSEDENNRKAYRLKNVQERFVGKTYEELDVEDRRRLDDSIIHATVIRQDQPTDDQSSIYVIFERLNTGGVNLQPQEIRVALYHGELVRVLTKLNDDTNWRILFGNRSKRLKDHEMILRFFAFLFYREKYRSPMKDFLNRYMAANRNLDRQSESEMTEIFGETCDAIRQGIGLRAFKPYRAVNAAVVDSLMVGVATRLSRGPIENQEEMKKAYESLIGQGTYQTAIESGTAQESNVSTRMQAAVDAFDGVS